MKTLRTITCAILLLPAAAFAAGDPGSASAPGEAKDPLLEKVGDATSRKDWAGAQSLLRDALAREPRNADYHNLYAYTVRKGANPDLSLVFKHYNQALSLDPEHKAAHEYIGEAYLMVGNVAKAREHLARLDKLCLFGCQEYRELKKAIAAYEAR